MIARIGGVSPSEDFIAASGNQHQCIFRMVLYPVQRGPTDAERERCVLA